MHVATPVSHVQHLQPQLHLLPSLADVYYSDLSSCLASLSSPSHPPSDSLEHRDGLSELLCLGSKHACSFVLVTPHRLPPAPLS